MTLKQIHSISYHLIWGSQREVAWDDITFPRKEGDLDIRDYNDLQMVSMIKILWRAWAGDGIWSSWI